MCIHLVCNDYNAIYIDQTDRNLRKRLDEHNKSIMNNNCSSAMPTHCTKNNIL